MSVIQSPRFVKIKRKASESSEPPTGFKKFKFVGSSESGESDALRRLIVEKTPALVPCGEEEDMLITDYEDFVFEKTAKSLPQNSEVITVNGVPLVQAPSNIGLEKEDEESQTKYVYDVYWYEEEESEDLVQEQEYREAREQDYSSNDEEHPDNDYPDDDSGSDYNHYGDNDDTRDMLEEFEAHKIRDSAESESDSLPDWAEDLS